MPTRLVHVVADAQDPARLARFWAALLGWEIADETGEEVDVWPAGYTYPDPVAVLHERRTLDHFGEALHPLANHLRCHEVVGHVRPTYAREAPD